MREEASHCWEIPVMFDKFLFKTGLAIVEMQLYWRAGRPWLECWAWITVTGQADRAQQLPGGRLANAGPEAWGISIKQGSSKTRGNVWSPSTALSNRSIWQWEAKEQRLNILKADGLQVSSLEQVCRMKSNQETMWQFLTSSLFFLL